MRDEADTPGAPPDPAPPTAAPSDPGRLTRMLDALRAATTAEADEALWVRFALAFPGRADLVGVDVVAQRADRMLAAVRERRPTQAKPGFGNGDAPRA